MHVDSKWEQYEFYRQFLIGPAEKVPVEGWSYHKLRRDLRIRSDPELTYACFAEQDREIHVLGHVLHTFRPDYDNLAIATYLSSNFRKLGKRIVLSWRKVRHCSRHWAGVSVIPRCYLFKDCFFPRHRLRGMLVRFVANNFIEVFRSAAEPRCLQRGFRLRS